MRHLILGGGGFIGSHLARRLKQQGHEVAVVDIDFPEYRYEQWKGVKTIYCDLLAFGQAGEKLFWFQKPWDVVWQLAADMGGVEYFHSERDWGAAVANQQINANVMAMIGHRWTKKKPRVIFTSTACALAVEKQNHESRRQSLLFDNDRTSWMLKEDDIYWGTPDQLYGQEKRNSAILWSRAPVDTRVCFLHTVYGPYQEHEGIRMKFPSAVAQKARKARETGTIELLGDGKQVRSYLYISDAIDRLLALGNSDTDPGYVNIGGVTPYTVDQVARIAAVAAGAYDHREGPTEDQLPELIHVPGPTGVEARCADMTKFYTAFPHLNTTPMVSLEQGMHNFIDWLDEIDG